MSNSLEKAIKQLSKDRDIILKKEDIQLLIEYIERITMYLGKRAYHLMNHCNRKTLMLKDIKNSIRIEISEKYTENLIKYSNYIVSRYFSIRKGYSIELLNEIFNYDRLCPSNILLELDILLPYNYFRQKLKLLNTYRVNVESTIFLISLINSLTITILNSYKGYNFDLPISKILENYKLHSDTID